MLECVIFDMDGVIIDSEPLHYEVNRNIFRELNIDVSAKEYNMFIGSTNLEMWTFLKNKYKLKEDLQELVEHQVDENMEYLLNNSQKPIDGVVELLIDLKNKNVPVCIASSSPLIYIELVLDSMNIRQFFKEIISGEHVSKSKPAPDIFLRAAYEMGGVIQKNCTVIEDSKNGVIAAKAAGMKCIGFRNLNSGKQDLSCADIIVDSLNALNVNKIQSLTND